MLSFRHPLPRLQTCLHPWHQRKRTKQIKATANYVDLKECDKPIANGEDDTAHVGFIPSWKISSIGKAAFVDRERCPQHDGVNDATLVSIKQNSSVVTFSTVP